MLPVSSTASTRAQLFFTHLVAILAPLLALAVFLVLTLPPRYRDEVARQMHVELQLARPLIADRLRLGASPSALEESVRRLAQQTGLRITLIARSGTVLAESERDPERLENHASRPEFQQAVRRGKGQAIRHSKTLGIDMLYVAAPVSVQGPVIRLATPLRQLNAVLVALRSLVIASVLGAAL